MLAARLTELRTGVLIAQVPITTASSSPNFDQSSLGSDDSGICCSASGGEKLRLTRSAEYLEDDDAMMQFDESKSLESEEMEFAPETPVTSHPEADASRVSEDETNADHTKYVLHFCVSVCVWEKHGLIVSFLISSYRLSAIATKTGEDGAGGKQSLLLRWFESKLFDMSYAVMYLFNSKESGVQTYIGNRVFSYPPRDVDFYLQQLVNMYIHMHDVAEVIHPYLVPKCFCRESFHVAGF